MFCVHSTTFDLLPIAQERDIFVIDESSAPLPIEAFGALR